MLPAAEESTAGCLWTRLHGPILSLEMFNSVISTIAIKHATDIEVRYSLSQLLDGQAGW